MQNHEAKHSRTEQTKRVKRASYLPCVGLALC